MRAVLLPCLLAGCVVPHHNGLTTASHIGDGGLALGAETGLSGFSGQALSTFNPLLDVSVRYGLSDRAELGGRVGSLGYEVIGKFVFTDAQAPLTVSVAPAGSIGFARLGGLDGGTIQYNVPVLFGLPLQRHELVFGPRVQHVIVFAGGNDSGGGTLLWTGLGAGASLRLTRVLRVHPELSGSLPVIATSVGKDDVRTVADGAPAAFGINVGLILLLGARDGTP